MGTCIDSALIMMFELDIHEFRQVTQMTSSQTRKSRVYVTCDMTLDTLSMLNCWLSGKFIHTSMI